MFSMKFYNTICRMKVQTHLCYDKADDGKFGRAACKS